MSAIEETHVPDLLHELRSRGRREPCEDAVALPAIPDAGPHLDEFVVAQGTVHFADDGRAEAALSDEHDRVAVVTEATEVLALGVVEEHRWRLRVIANGPGSLERTCAAGSRRQSTVSSRRHPGVGPALQLPRQGARHG